MGWYSWNQHWNPEISETWQFMEMNDKPIMLVIYLYIYIYIDTGISWSDSNQNAAGIPSAMGIVSLVILHHMLWNYCYTQAWKRTHHLLWSIAGRTFDEFDWWYPRWIYIKWFHRSADQQPTPTKHNAPAFHSQHQRTPGQKWRCGIHSQGLARRRSQRCCCLNDTSFPMRLNDLDLIYRTITLNTHLQFLPANWSYKIMLGK